MGLKFFKTAVSACLLLTLGACVPAPKVPPPRDNVANGTAVGVVAGGLVGAAAGAGIPGVVASAAVGGVVGAAVGSRTGAEQPYIVRLTDYLQSQGIRFIYLGEYITIVVPADLIYYAHSPRIRWAAYPILNQVAAYLRYFQKVDVELAVFTDNMGSKERSHALTDNQSKRIVDYLSRKGIDSRLFYGIGYGNGHPIASNASTGGQTLNRRVEITFQRLVD